MLELLLCSLFTILPDFLYRRYWQNKRLGKEITIFTVWYELRFGITFCLMLTVSLITTVFYVHPSTTSVTFLFRSVPILPEINSRVAEVYVGSGDKVEKGQPIFRLDDSKQKAALELAKRKIEEVEAALIVGRSEISATEGQVKQAESSFNQALQELRTKQELQRRNASVVSAREVEQLEILVAGKEGSLAAAKATQRVSESRVADLLPAERASAEAALRQAEVDLSKTIIRAGVDATVEQFVLRVGDIVNPLMRPAGILVPLGQQQLVAGFGQIESQVIKVGMKAEVSCLSRPWTILPMVVARVQNYIAAGQFRVGEQLIEFQQLGEPGSIAVVLEPLFDGGLRGLTPGSSCIANAYTSHHDELNSGDIGFLKRVYFHVLDGVGLVHAMILRLQIIVLPFKVLVFGGH